MSHPLLILPGSTSEFQRTCNALRGHHRHMHGADADIAAALRRAIPDLIRARGGSRAIIGHADARVMAYRVVRPLMDAAVLNDKIARLYVTSYNRWVQYVVNASNGPAPRNRINVDG